MQNTIDVYTMDLNDAHLDMRRLSGLLDPEESRRAERFRSAADRTRYIARRAGLRKLLSRYLHRRPASISFATNEFGKPFLKGTDLHFSVSHSLHVALFAIARGRELGCDIEHRDPAFPWQEIADAFFSPSELRSLRGLGASDRVEAFFVCWTLKEAYLKARGCGFHFPLDSFEASLASGQPAMMSSGHTGWSVYSFEPLTGFQAAVVAQSADWKLKLGILDLARW